MEQKQRVKRVYKRKVKELEKMEDIPEMSSSDILEGQAGENKSLLGIKDTNTISINYPMPNDTYKLVLNIEFPELKEKIMNLLNLKDK